MARSASAAAQCRRRRETFVLALQLGCAPSEAENELRRRTSQALEQAVQQRMFERDARQSRIADAYERPQPWHKKD